MPQTWRLSRKADPSIRPGKRQGDAEEFHNDFNGQMRLSFG